MHVLDRIVLLPLLLSGGLAACVSAPPRVARIHTAPQIEPSFAANIEQYYPLPSRDLGEEGSCSVDVRIDAAGSVSDARILASTGFATLDDACIDAMMNAHFEPATDNGVAVEARLSVPIVWALPTIVAPTLQRGYVLEVGDSQYPDEARRLHQEGDCIVGVFVQIDGTPHDTYLYQSTGYRALDTACLAAVTKARFTPGSKSGVARAMPMRVPISWRLGKY